MDQRYIDIIRYQINNWQDADVRTVPGVMTQIHCGPDKDDPSIEYQINWFIDCSETYIHNHRHSFDTHCLEGGYSEKLWQIVDEGSGACTYQFLRHSGNVFDSPIKLPGALQHVGSRIHFPGNILHVGIDQYHAILPNASSAERVLTFLVKHTPSIPVEMFVLSDQPVINAPKNEIQPATEEDRQSLYDKLDSWLAKHHY